jgi:hypothetical protein
MVTAVFAGVNGPDPSWYRSVRRSVWMVNTPARVSV